MFRTILAMFVSFALGVPVEAEAPAKLKLGKPVVFLGELAGNLDISGGVSVGEFLLVISKEAHGVQVLKDTGDSEYKVVGFIALALKGTDLDIEALTADGTTIYATGSHSKLRKIGRKDGPDGGIGPVIAIPTRNRVFEVELALYPRISGQLTIPKSAKWCRKSPGITVPKAITGPITPPVDVVIDSSRTTRSFPANLRGSRSSPGSRIARLRG